jgi:hypothetical protein
MSRIMSFVSTKPSIFSKLLIVMLIKVSSRPRKVKPRRLKIDPLEVLPAPRCLSIEMESKMPIKGNA